MLRVRVEATCQWCQGRGWPSDPLMHVGKVTVQGRMTTDSYAGVYHAGCVDKANESAAAVSSSSSVRASDDATKADDGSLSQGGLL